VINLYRDFHLQADMKGKVTALTGAAGGIGQETARLFAQNGSDLLLIDRDPAVDDLAADLMQHFGIQAEPLCMDLEAPDAAVECAQHCRLAFGHCEVLINNAAIGCDDILTKLTQQDWDRSMHMNLKVPFLLSQSFGIHFMIPAGYGRIINISSQAGIVALDGHASYSVAKAGLMALTRALALEWGQYGITANAIAPTVIETDFAKSYWHGERAQKHIEQIPVGRFGRPKEVAGACLYLASDAAGLISGTNLMMDGGYTIR
jgi:NAD(P)-dependent dehydrogenase (short-subunit alcohol dehydrogenase family)